MRRGSDSGSVGKMGVRDLLTLAAFMFVIACGSSGDTGGTGAGGPGGIASGAGGETISIGAGTNGSTGSGLVGNEDTCDGVDNDGNGIIGDGRFDVRIRATP